MDIGSWHGGVANWWGTIDWGTAPDWLAATGTISAVVFALWQVRRDANLRRAAEVAQKEQAEAEEKIRRRRNAQRLFVDIEAIMKGEPGYEESRNRGRKLARVRTTNRADEPFVSIVIYNPNGNRLLRIPHLAPYQEMVHFSPRENIDRYRRTHIVFADSEGTIWSRDPQGKVAKEGEPGFSVNPPGGPDPATPQPTLPAPDPADARSDPPRPDEPS